MEILAVIVIVVFVFISWLVGRKLLDSWDCELPGWGSIMDIIRQFMTLFLGICIILLCLAIAALIILVFQAIYQGMTTGCIY